MLLKIHEVIREDKLDLSRTNTVMHMIVFEDI